MDAFLGEIRIFGFNYAPSGWAFCNGAVVPINQYQALAAVIGNTYGGTAGQTIGLPNLQGRAAAGMGGGPGLTSRAIGAAIGEETVTLNMTQMGMHSHALNMASVPFTSLVSAPAAGSWIAPPIHNTPAPHVSVKAYAAAASTQIDTTLSPQTIGLSQGTNASPHPNMQPWLAMNFCICLSGEFPLRP